MNDLQGRISNARNPHQGRFPKVLCVCSASLLRSPTIAWVLSNEPYNCNTRCVGTAPEYALTPIDEAYLEWAEIIVCADYNHYVDVMDLIKKLKRENQHTIYCLDIPDTFQTRNPKLIEIIKESLARCGFTTDKTHGKK